MTEQLEKALYVVATPIGNLGDITHRALHILKEVDIIAAEDTRNSKSLLSHFGLSGRLIAVHEHNEYHAADGIIKLLSEGKSVALVTDAGTPAISDPGSHLVEKVMAAGHRIIPIPGPSALIAAISASGLGEQGFLFHGFLPAKSKDRKNVLTSLRNAALPYVLVFYESPHRIAETVADLCEVFESTSELVICRELTKKFETIQRLPLLQAMHWLAADENQRRGEFVLILLPQYTLLAGDADQAKTHELEKIMSVLLAELPVKQAVSIAVSLTGEKKNKVYSLALSLKDKSIF